MRRLTRSGATGIVAPRPGPGITPASATDVTPCGTASVSWPVDGDTFTLELTVPPNTTAEVLLPDGGAMLEAGAGVHAFERTITVPAPVEKSKPHGSP